jgi:putative DNA primase/helicase
MSTDADDAKVIDFDKKREQARRRPPEFSDEALALRFADAHCGELRYVALWSRWMVFDAGVWKPDDTRLAFSLAREVCRRAASECSVKKAKLAAQLASAKTRAAVITLANDDRRLAATSDQWDRNPDLLNLGGGQDHAS